MVAAVVHGSGGRVRLPQGGWRDLLIGGPLEGELELGEPPLALIQRATS